jgi:hypothetical protein
MIIKTYKIEKNQEINLSYFEKNVNILEDECKCRIGLKPIESA